VSVDVSFPEEGETPRLVLMECHGAKIAIGALRDGSLAVVPIYDGERRQQRDIQGALRGFDETTWMKVIPGARYRFELQVRPSTIRQLSLTIKVEGREVVSGHPVRLPRNRAATLVLTPHHPMTLLRVETRGTADG
jgi:hypothetical protein